MAYKQVDSNLSAKERKLIKAVRYSLPMSAAEEFLIFQEQKMQSEQEELAKIEKELHEAEEIYLPVKQKFEEFKAKHDKTTTTYTQLLAYMKNPNAKELAFYNANIQKQDTAIVHSGIKDDKAVYGKNSTGKRRYGKRNFKWLVMAEEILREKQIFLSVDIIWSAMCNKYPAIKDLCLQDKGLHSAVKYNLMAGAKRELVRKERVIVEWDEKLGLAEWVNSDGKPVGKYLAATMMRNNTSNHLAEAV